MLHSKLLQAGGESVKAQNPRFETIDFETMWEHVVHRVCEQAGIKLEDLKSVAADVQSAFQKYREAMDSNQCSNYLTEGDKLLEEWKAADLSGRLTMLESAIDALEMQIRKLFEATSKALLQGGEHLVDEVGVLATELVAVRAMKVKVKAAGNIIKDLAGAIADLDSSTKAVREAAKNDAPGWADLENTALDMVNKADKNFERFKDEIQLVAIPCLLATRRVYDESNWYGDKVYRMSMLLRNEVVSILHMNDILTNMMVVEPVKQPEKKQSHSKRGRDERDDADQGRSRKKMRGCHNKEQQEMPPTPDDVEEMRNSVGSGKVELAGGVWSTGEDFATLLSEVKGLHADYQGASPWGWSTSKISWQQAQSHVLHQVKNKDKQSSIMCACNELIGMLKAENFPGWPTTKTCELEEKIKRAIMAAAVKWETATKG